MKKINYNIPSYQECLNVVNKYPPKTFYEKIKFYDGYSLSFFNYRYAGYKEFEESKAFEMKGITFLHHNGSSKAHLMFNKFWEINQYPQFNYDLYKDKKIKKVMMKEDGNLVSFIKLPNGKIISRVKEGLESKFNITSNKFIKDNPIYYNFINWCMNNDIVPLFELVGENRIVLKYNKNNLILLNLRDNKTGEYLDEVDYKMEGIDTIKRVNYTLDELMTLAKTEEEIEGWVVQFEDDIFLKIKTEWYYEMSKYILEKLNIKKGINRNNHLMYH
jgi:T4 RnlA family RNA ligase